MNTPGPTVWPTLQARSAKELIDWLTTVVGFEATAVYTDGGDTVVHAQLDWPEGGGIMLGDNNPKGFSREPGTGLCYVVTDHVDALFEKVKAAGAKIIHEPVDQDYGNREFLVADPEGNLWSFGAYRGEPRK
ncbi:VOC family protein [Hoyosella altamirensis]|uniref:Putative glyoxalase superfamily protein PhnB n=1 Tax=Hoyosella altamirensis TaxID=616997 RepID=A0A839RJN7_9ACTN|nr:VOC family protein [Hoyosella altamirensis]MBB3036617.1 putative glyoxalase superfamily protein PhnB [Hoyosella altamirensis]